MGATWKDPGFASRGVPQLAMMIAEEEKIFCILLAILTCVQVCINVCLYVQLDKFRAWCFFCFRMELLDRWSMPIIVRIWTQDLL